MPRPLDHLVLATHDLTLQAAFYRRLGFHVGSRNRHPWGTENHIVQFDGSFLELIGLGEAFASPADQGERVFSFAGFIACFLRQRQGAAMLVLRSADAEKDRLQFRQAEIGDFEPFSFRRKAKRSDGSEAEVAFTLAFARSPAIPAAGFFVCEQHFPENFWNPAFQQHDNTARSVRAVTMVAANPADHGEFLRAFTGAETVQNIEHGIEIETGGGRINVVTGNGYRALYDRAMVSDEPHLAALEIGVADLRKVEAIMRRSKVAFGRSHNRLIVAAEAAFGCAIAFAHQPLPATAPPP